MYDFLLFCGAIVILMVVGPVLDHWAKSRAEKFYKKYSPKYKNSNHLNGSD